MNKKSTIFLLIFLAFFGSAITFYATNLFMSDICNGAVTSITLISTFPALMISFAFILAIMYVVRINKRIEYKKAYTKKYSFILLVFASIGVVTSILSGTIVYSSFFKGNPFVGYSFITLIDNLILLALAIYIRFFFIKKMKEDNNIFKTKFSYRLYTAVLAFVLYYALNKFGGVILMPIFVQYSTLYFTFPVYLSLVLPLLFLLFVELGNLNVGNKKVLSIVFLSLVVVLNSSVIIIGKSELGQALVSAVSFVEPLERLGSMPMDTIFRTVLLLGLGIYYLIKSLKKVKEA